MSTFGLENKRVVITGAAGGIGVALSRAFTEAGSEVILLGLPADGVNRLAAELGPKARPLVCDIADTNAIEEMAAAVEKLGGADVLVNNAGILRPAPLAEVEPQAWEFMLKVNLTGSLFMAQKLLPQLSRNGDGAIVHIASISASNPQPFSGAYSPSKAAIVMLARQMAAEWGPMGVRCNVVSPGLIRTPLSEAFYADENVKRQREQMVPLRRIAAPQDMAGPVLFLASRHAAYVTGQEIVADGGLSQSLMGLVPRPGYSPK